ncbi:repeat-containing protein E_02 [Orientia tsutsugamushi str. Ikeda]|uniref:Repeat-containing protein E_02 n=2 Tax=Orientia tsutsugamushi TaxID=784 RepID=B3CU54_ORITI|nr:repeat-containing protein E_02 [Orientia tsutsugamushi str. Ikeda]
METINVTELFMENSDIISSTVADMTSAVTDMTSVVTDMTSVVTDMTSVVTDMTSAVTDMTSAVTDMTSVVTDMTSVVTDMTSTVTDMTSAVTDMTSTVTDIGSTISSIISSTISSTINSIISSTTSDEMIGNNSQSQESEGYYYSQLGTWLAVGFTICTLGAVCGLAYLYKKRTNQLEDKSSKNYELSDLNCVKVDIPLQEKNEIKVLSVSDVNYEDNGNNESHIPSNDLDNNLLGVNVTEHLS